MFETARPTIGDCKVHLCGEAGLRQSPATRCALDLVLL
jgi:hypothetical protein